MNIKIIQTIKYSLIVFISISSYPLCGHAQEDYENWPTLEQLKKLATLGDPQAEYIVGNMYFEGKKLPKNYVKAKELIEKAAKQGNIQAMGSIAGIYWSAKNISKVIEWYKKAADQGNVAAMESLGGIYRSGDYNIPKNPTQALYWYKKAADQGDTDILLSIGTIYLEQKNYEESTKYFEKAARQGNELAINNLGHAYEEGKGVQKDLAKAKLYYQRACLYSVKWGCEGYYKLTKTNIKD